MRAFNLVVFLVGVVLTGCSSLISYTPALDLHPADAMRVVERSLEEQPTGAATEISVTPERASFASRQRRLIGSESGPLRITFYFDTFGRTDLMAHKGKYIVRVWDRSGVFRFRVYFADEARAKRFMDAMGSLGAKAAGQ